MTQPTNSPNNADFTNKLAGLAGIGPEQIGVILGTYELLKQIQKAKPEPLTWHPHLTYQEDYTLEFWKICKATLKQWVDAGMKRLPAGNKEFRYYGQDVLDFRREVEPKVNQLRGAAKKAANKGESA